MALGTWLELTIVPDVPHPTNRRVTKPKNLAENPHMQVRGMDYGYLDGVKHRVFRLRGRHTQYTEMWKTNVLAHARYTIINTSRA